MKKNILNTIVPILFFCLFSFKAFSQSSPVTFNFISKISADNQYEIHISAKIQQPWHIYAQLQPKGSINIPTIIKFNKNPLVNFEGEIKEVGLKESVTEKSLNSSSWLYHNSVDFIQIMYLKKNVNTNITGSITFQVCNEKECLRPATIPFNLKLVHK